MHSSYVSCAVSFHVTGYTCHAVKCVTLNCQKCFIGDEARAKMREKPRFVVKLGIGIEFV